MYLLDANIFITAKNLHYGFDFVPAFWEWLDQGHTAGILCSTNKVRQELAVGADELATWIGGRNSIFLAPDAATTPSMQRLAEWANSRGFTSAAIAEFFSAADFELVAYAHAHDHTIVTHERPDPNARKKIFIPDACDALGVKWMDPYTMLRNTGAQFVLGGSLKS